MASLTEDWFHKQIHVRTNFKSIILFQDYFYRSSNSLCLDSVFSSNAVNLIHFSK